MYVVNTTYIVEPTLDTAWRQWLQETLLPQLGDAHTLLTRVLAEEPTDHLTYSLQIDAGDVPQMQAVRHITAQPMPFGEHVLTFTTVLKKINL